MGTHLGYFVRRMLDYGNWVKVQIRSAPSEWVGLFDLEPAIHRIKISVNNIRPVFEIILDTQNVECALSLEVQFRETKAVQLVYRHFKAEWSNMRLVSETRIQKIYVPYRFNLKKDFTIEITYSELFQKYFDDYMGEDGRNLDIEPLVIAPEQEKEEMEDFWNTTHYFNSMTPKEFHNIENMMEG